MNTSRDFKATPLIAFIGLIFLALPWTAAAETIIVNHTSTAITQIPQSAIAQAKTALHIAYGHTSHGSQLTDGMTGLVDFANNGGLGLNLPDNIFQWNNGGSDNALDLHDHAMGGDAGYYPAWVNNTRQYLGAPDPASGKGTAHPDTNVIIWSWCGQVDAKYAAGTLHSEYLTPMNQLEVDYPGIFFVYMTGHVDIWDDENNKAANQVIRDFCLANHKILYDFADIERYNPDGAYFEYVNDNCNYYSASGGTLLGNWAREWQNSHTEGVDWYSCGSAHTEPLNANLKAYAAWWLWARLAGWNPSASQDTDNDGIADNDDNCPNTKNPDQADSDYDGIGDACDDVSNIPGDINGDKSVDMDDMILSLKSCAGFEIESPINLEADVDGNNQIGMSEALFILTHLSGAELPSEGLVKSSVLYEAAPIFSDAEQAALVAGFSEFTLDFYHALRKEPSRAGQNIFFSAYSIENALAMTWAGAINQTNDQMGETMHLNLPQERFHPTLNALNININSRDDQQPPSGDPFALNLVNAVWSKIGYPFLTDYLDVIARNYDAGVQTLDFEGNPDGSRQIINGWVEDQTNEKIKDLLPVGSISPLTAVVLTNAIYFMGSWHEKFDVERTAPGAFTLVDGSVVSTELMHRQKDTRYFKGSGFDAVELPYASPKFPEGAYPQELAMLVIIPHPGEFQSVENGLDTTGIGTIMNSLSMGTVDLTFPKFEFECETMCKDILKNLGMEDAFDPFLADFSGMVNPVHSRPWIDEVYHKAFVAVDENGTEAAAATAVVMSETGIPEIIKISADRPFVFVIYDHFTKTILFMGRVLDPTA